jgi:hypothetical protein
MEKLPFGFEWVEQRPARFEAQRELPGGGVVRFSAAEEAKVRGQVAAWCADQLRRKDGGLLGATP